MSAKAQESINLICRVLGGPDGGVSYAGLNLTPKKAGELFRLVEQVYHSPISKIKNFYGVFVFGSWRNWGNADLGDLPNLDSSTWYAVNQDIEIDGSNDSGCTESVTIKAGEILFQAYDRHSNSALEYESATLSLAILKHMSEVAAFPIGFFDGSEIQELRS